jgi:fermentation-respiration switch protein FrsA (DUF1100 family)
MRALRRVAIALAAAGALLAGACFAEQRVLFPGRVIRDGREVALGPGAERLWLDFAGARAEAFFLGAGSGAASPGPLLVYAHGNGELIDDWVDHVDALRASGVSVLLVEYPGYGRSSGTPSQASITRTLVSAYDWATSQPQVDSRRVIGHGRSLGGGAICALARERSLAALVLESTFTSVREMATALYGLPGFLVRNPFDNLSAIRGFSGPILLLHGERDEAIPVDHARRLHAAAPTSELEVVGCGHNDCPLPWPLVTAFLSRHRLL